MRKPISSLLFCIVTLSQPLAGLSQKPIDHGGKIETRYDGFAFETVMRLQKMKVNCTGLKGNFQDFCVSIDVALHCPGTQVNYVGNVTLQLIFETRSWNEAHPAGQRDLSIMADTDTMRLGTMRVIPKADQVLREKNIETLEVTIPYKVFQRITQAQSLQFQVGSTTVELREKNLLALRDLANRVVK